MPIKSYLTNSQMDKTRLRALRERMSEKGLGSVLIQTMEDIYWLTGFNTPGAPRCQALIVNRNDVVIHSRDLEVTNAPEGVPISGYKEGEDPVAHLFHCITLSKRVGIQFGAERAAPSDQNAVCGMLTRQGVELEDVTSMVKDLRVVKTEHEIILMKRAAAICVASIVAAIKATGEPYASEKTIAGAAIFAAMGAGGDHAAYPPFVAIGPNGSRGHYACSDPHVPVSQGTGVFIELAGCFQRYHVAMMRTVYVGDSVPRPMFDAEAHIVNALTNMRRAAIPGSTHGAVRKAARDALEPLELSGWILSKRSCYNIGVGFAVDWGEVDNSEDAELRENATLHILPWVTHPTYGAVGLSDTIIVRPAGAVSVFPSNKPQEQIYLASKSEPILDTVNRVLAVFPTAAITPTPLRKMMIDSLEVSVKDESNRFGQKSFKSLGGGYALACELIARSGGRLTSFNELCLGPPHGVTFATASDGNHGAGVAWAAELLGCRAVIWFPKNVAQSRIDTAAGFRATVIVTELPYDETVKHAAITAERRGWVLVQDTAWEGYTRVPRNIMDAYSLIAHEVVQQSDVPLTHIILQVGVGSFAAGVASYFRETAATKEAKIITIEPEATGCFFASVIAGEKSAVPTPVNGSIAAGLDCCILSDLSWPVLRDCVNTAVMVSDAVIALGTRIAHGQGVNSGESGAAVGVGFLSAAGEQIGICDDSHVLIFNTEGVTAPELTAQILSEQTSGNQTVHMRRNPLCLYS